MKKVEIYTDSGCKGNQNPINIGACAYILMCDGHIKEGGSSHRNTTNNAMELLAVLSALRCLKYRCNVTIYSDSAYITNAVNQGWITRWIANGWRTANRKPVKNKQLWLELHDELNKHEVTMTHVRAHSGNKWNERVDGLVIKFMDKM